MRILHAIPSLSGGGAERQLGYLVAALATMGHAQDVAYIALGPAAENADLSRAGLYRLEAAGDRDPRILFRLIALILKTKPDILQTWLPQMDVFGGLAALLTRTRWVLREASCADFYKKRWQTDVRAQLAKYADMIVSNSNAGDQYWTAACLRKITAVIPNGLPFELIDGVPSLADKLLPCEPNEKIVLYAGGLKALKRVNALIQAVGLLGSELPVKLVICGSGPEAEPLQEQARSQGIANRVRFTGFLEPPDVWAWMKQADVFVHLSAEEGFPNSVTEAMVCGCPLILSDIAAHRELIDNGSGLIVSPVAVDVAAAIRSVLLEPEAAKRRAIFAKSKSAEWTIPVMARRYETIYNQLSSARPNEAITSASASRIS